MIECTYRYDKGREGERRAIRDEKGREGMRRRGSMKDANALMLNARMNE